MDDQGSFWHGTHSSPLNDLFDRGDFTLEEVLDQEDVLTQCKCLNSDLIGYLSQYDVMEKMIKYLILSYPVKKDTAQESKETEHGGTESGTGSSDAPRGEGAEGEADRGDTEALIPPRYPHIVAELFACEVDKLLSTLVDEESLLQLLFSILDTDQTLDPSCVGYFRRIVNILIQRKSAALLQFVQKNKVVDKLIQHIALSSILELLVLIGWETASDVEWLYQENLIPKLVKCLSPSNDSTVYINASKALVDVVLKFQYPKSSSLVSQLQNPFILKDVFTFMLSTAPYAFCAAAPIVIVLVNRDISRRIELPEDVDDDGELPYIVETLLEHMEKIIDILRCPPDVAAVVQDEYSVHQGKWGTEEKGTRNRPVEEEATGRTEENSTEEAKEERKEEATEEAKGETVAVATTGGGTASTGAAAATGAPQRYARFGEARLKAMEIIYILFRCSYKEVNKALEVHCVLSVMLDLFFEYQWNNMLHGIVEKIVHSILQDSELDRLRRAMVVEAQLVERCYTGYELNEVATKRPKGCRLGYMGHVYAIVDSLAKSAEKDAAFLELLSGTTVWDKLVGSYFTTEQQIQSIQIGGSRPTNLSNDEDGLDGLDGLDDNWGPTAYFHSNVDDNGDDDDTSPYFNDKDDDADGLGMSMGIGMHGIGDRPHEVKRGFGTYGKGGFDEGDDNDADDDNDLFSLQTTGGGSAWRSDKQDEPGGHYDDRLNSIDEAERNRRERISRDINYVDDDDDDDNDDDDDDDDGRRFSRDGMERKKAGGPKALGQSPSRRDPALARRQAALTKADGGAYDAGNQNRKSPRSGRTSTNDNLSMLDFEENEDFPVSRAAEDGGASSVEDLRDDDFDVDFPDVTASAPAEGFSQNGGGRSDHLTSSSETTMELKLTSPTASDNVVVSSSGDSVGDSFGDGSDDFDVAFPDVVPATVPAPSFTTVTSSSSFSSPSSEAGLRVDLAAMQIDEGKFSVTASPSPTVSDDGDDELKGKSLSELNPADWGFSDFSSA